MSSLIDIAFPYRRRRSYGAASFAFTFLVLLFEVELLAFVGVAIAARQLQLWWDLQPIVFPTACLISLAAAAVFWWRARSWSKRRVETLEAWARDSGASPRTVARLFRQELGTTFVQWRQQVLLAKALAMAARRVPMSTIAAELGYASPSAFSAMVRRSVGAPPSRFFA